MAAMGSIWPICTCRGPRTNVPIAAMRVPLADPPGAAADRPAGDSLGRPVGGVLAFLPLAQGIVIGSGGTAALSQKYGQHGSPAGVGLMTPTILSMISRPGYHAWYPGLELLVHG
jgi:hypothetical protein